MGTFILTYILISIIFMQSLQHTSFFHNYQSGVNSTHQQPKFPPPERLPAILFIYDAHFFFRTSVERFLLSISSQTFYMDSSPRNGHSVCAHSLNTFALLGKVEIYGPITPVRFVVPLLKRSYKSTRMWVNTLKL